MRTEINRLELRKASLMFVLIAKLNSMKLERVDIKLSMSGRHTLSRSHSLGVTLQFTPRQADTHRKDAN